MTHAKQLTLGLDGPQRAPDVFAIGHSNRPIERFLALLRHHAIAHVADVRSIPYSRRHPQFSREALREALAGAGIGYSHWPDLGGKREASATLRSYADYAATPPFAASLTRLETEAARTRLAFMCAEADIRQCHRQYIAAALEARGQVVHPIGDADLDRGPTS